MPIKFDKSLATERGIGTPVIFQYSADGVTGWSPTLDTAIHKYWRWSTNGGASFSPNLVPFTPLDMDATKFGWFNYDNSVASQLIPAETWTTLQNDALGIETITAYSPADIDSMLDTATGRILLEDLQVGDEVYIRHTINVTPMANNTTYSFSHLFGSGLQSYRLPIGVPSTLNEGGGVPTGTFLVDTHFFVKDNNSRLGGMLPQIYVTGDSMVNYTGCYLSVNRR